MWGFKRVIWQRLMVLKRPKVRGQPGSQMPWIGRCTLYLASDWLRLCPFLRWITNFIALPTGLLSVKPKTARQKSNWTRNQIRAAGAKGSLTFNESPQAAMLLFPDVCLLLRRSWTMSESGKWSKMWVNLHFNYILLVKVGKYDVSVAGREVTIASDQTIWGPG